MFRMLLTTTALTALLSVGAMAQEAAAPATDAAAPAATDAVAPAADSSILAKGYAAVDSDNLATNIIGKQVYSSEAENAEHIGDVNNLVVNQDGTVAAVIIGVGGFLGVGEKNVAVNYDELKWTVAADNSERFVLATTKEALEAAPTFEWVDDQPADAAANNAAPAADNNSMAAAPADKGAVQTVDPAQLTDVTLTADELEGTEAYGPNNEHLGDIGDVVLGSDGKTVDAVVVDFGGFLGIGTKPVAVGFDTLKFKQDANGKRFVFLNVTRDQLDKAPAFDADTYKTDPASQRLVVEG